MNSKVIMAAFLILSVISSTYGSWQDYVDQLLQEDNAVQQEMLIEKIVKSDPNWREVYDYLRNISFESTDTSGLLLRYTMCIDSVERPWVIYIPESYDCTRPTPLFVQIHGLANRRDVIGDPVQYETENEFLKLASDNGWFMIFPMAQFGATWWDEVGMANIKNLIRTVKCEFNIDDDRVYMGGFSDGASAAFLFAMTDPTDFGAFVALNGHMGVGSEDGGIHTYAPNMASTPIYVVNTFNDKLYPSRMMRPTIEMAIQAGGDIHYREFEGVHDFDYAETELPLIADFLERHPRDPFPVEITWEAADKEYGQCKWLAIDEINTDPPEIWHVDYNVTLIDSTISIGFIPAEGYDGEGIEVGILAEGEFLANRIGMKAGDIIIKADNMAIPDFEALSAFKEGLKRSDYVELTVIRDGGEITLKGNMPQPRNYYLFHRSKPSALVTARFIGNKVEVKTSCTGAFSINIHPDMVRLDNEVVIEVNDNISFEQEVLPDLSFMLENFLANRDRNLIFVAEVKLNL